MVTAKWCQLPSSVFATVWYCAEAPAVSTPMVVLVSLQMLMSLELAVVAVKSDINYVIKKPMVLAPV